MKRQKLVDKINAEVDGHRYWHGTGNTIVMRVETANREAWSYRRIIGLSYSRLAWHTNVFMSDALRKRIWAILKSHCPVIGMVDGEELLGEPS